MRRICRESFEQPPAILAHLVEELLTLVCSRGKARVTRARSIALAPLGLHLSAQPVRGNDRQHTLGVTRRFYHTFRSMECTKFGEDVGRVGPLAPMGGSASPALCTASTWLPRSVLQP